MNNAINSNLDNKVINVTYQHARFQGYPKRLAHNHLLDGGGAYGGPPYGVVRRWWNNGSSGLRL